MFFSLISLCVLPRLHCNGLEGSLISFSSHFYMESVSLVLQGGLEYWNAGILDTGYWNICVRFMSLVFVLLCSYIYSPPVLYILLLDGTVRRRGVVYRFFSLCMVAFTKYGFYAFGHFDISNYW
jgi:hypothetical protein